MQGDPCSVCGSVELKLIDGFYYCVECDTQNENVRETVVEQKTLGDGTFALTTKRKIVQLQDSKIQMSGEWYKWHAYNFILLGLADELVVAGAKPSFKIKLLWIWTNYIKKYQIKEELGLARKTQDVNNQNETLPTFMFEENSTSNPAPNDEDELETGEKPRKTKNKNIIMDGSRRDIKFFSKGVIIAMLYLALNLDESDIQLSHLFRFIHEKHLNFSNVQRFVPEDIHVKSIQEQWTNFLHSKVCNMHYVRALAVSLLRKLDLGTPKVPDLRKIVNNILQELCLPNDMKPLINSLMHLHRCDFLDVNNKTKEFLVRIPDYEGVVMSYILVALKMCFGLDGDYEEKLSNAVEKINEERDLLKSHRIGKYSEPSNRLFSFREWCSFMQCRKVMLCKCSLNMAEQHCLDIDDYVYLEHMGPRTQRNKELQDETAMDLLNKIPEDNEGRVIPKELFLPTLTPMSDYTDIIIDHTQDQERKYILSEDFTQYSLKYACEYLDLPDINAESIIKGVSEHGKTINKIILGTIVTKKSKSEMVYVKNCENINWMKTNPPTIEHITCEDEQNESNDKESDHGYDSENPVNEKEVSEHLVITADDTDTHEQSEIEEKKQVIITEEDDDKNIFDDTFEELDIKDEMELNNLEEFNLSHEDQLIHKNYSLHDDRASMSDDSDAYTNAPPFNPETFDREQTIKELILHACKKYKIPVPTEYKSNEPRKRRANIYGDEDRPTVPRKRAKRGETKMKVEELLSNYYTHMQSDLLSKMQEEVSLAIRNTTFDSILNVSQSVEQPSDAISRKSTCTENVENQSIPNPNQSLLEQSEKENNKEQNPDETDIIIDKDFESKLFGDEEEIKLDDLLPKGDPKFDEEKYDISQLYIKKHEIEEQDLYDLKDYPKLEEIISKKIEECRNNTEFSRLQPEPIVKDVIVTKYESDSDDDVPLSVMQDTKKQIEAMISWEESFDPLINKELSDFKYWFRHYDSDFMTRSTDWHKKFDDELKQNTPRSFYFVIRECASILNCSTFYLYKHMQNLEEFIIAKAK